MQLWGYSLCSQYEREVIKDEKECRLCYVADLARRDIGRLERGLEGLRG